MSRPSISEPHMAALGRRVTDMPELVGEGRVCGDLAQMVLRPDDALADESPAVSVGRLATAFISQQASLAKLAARHESLSRTHEQTASNCRLYERRNAQLDNDLKVAGKMRDHLDKLKQSYADEVRELRRAVEKALSRVPGSKKKAREYLAAADTLHEERQALIHRTENPFGWWP